MAQEAVTIFVNPEPLQHDPGDALVYYSPEGRYHRISGVVNEADFAPRDWLPVKAIRTKVAGRMVEIFLAFQGKEQEK